MTLNETMKQFESLGDEKMRAYNAKSGADDKQFGVKHGDIRVLAKKIKADHNSAMSLWQTGNIDAEYLAILLIEPKDLSAKEANRMVRSVTFAWDLRGWQTGLTTMLSSSIPTRNLFARNGWPPTTAGRLAQGGASPPSGS
jgi:hypothetical protein